MISIDAYSQKLGWRKILYFDWLSFLIVLLICSVGLLTLYGVAEGNFSKWAEPQAFRMGLGIFAMFVISFLPPRMIQYSIIPFYLAVVFLLILTLVVGVEVKGARRWLDVGFMRLQASEFAKLAIVLTLAQFYSLIDAKYRSNIFVVAAALVIIFVPALLTVIQPDGGTAVFIVLVGLLIMLVAGVSWYYYILGIIPVIFAVLALGIGLADYGIERHGPDKVGHLPQSMIHLHDRGVDPEAGTGLTNWIAHKVLKDEWIDEYQARQIENNQSPKAVADSPISMTETVAILMRHLIHDYQFKRIDVYFDPHIDPSGEGYHILQSWITLGSGGLTGKGFMQGSQTRLKFILENQTDFIFTSYAEYFGYLGTMFLLSLFVGLTLLLAFNAWRNNSRYGGILIGGICLLFFMFYMINLSMVMGLIPVVGVPLPLISYGGSVVLMLFIAFGYVQNAHINRPRE